ncbi:MAG: hypothetical protein GAK41_00876 [Burkholderia gladioli]|nr:MAG: hypothetical protein GAK41_00876 [Burkholderia gladioli]
MLLSLATAVDRIAVWPAVLELTSAVTSVLTSRLELPVEPLMIDCAACCTAELLLIALLDVDDVDEIVDIAWLRGRRRRR